eukprot:6259461-Lingulodinium_polyedra.AAC.1
MAVTSWLQGWPGGGAHLGHIAQEIAATGQLGAGGVGLPVLCQVVEGKVDILGHLRGHEGQQPWPRV